MFYVEIDFTFEHIYSGKLKPQNLIILEKLVDR
jgi:hypothetical protein